MRKGLSTRAAPASRKAALIGGSAGNYLVMRLIVQGEMHAYLHACMLDNQGSDQVTETGFTECCVEDAWPSHSPQLETSW